MKIIAYTHSNLVYSQLPLLYKKSISFGLFDMKLSSTEKHTGFIIQNTNIKKDFGNCAALVIKKKCCVAIQHAHTSLSHNSQKTSLEQNRRKLFAAPETLKSWNNGTSFAVKYHST